MFIFRLFIVMAFVLLSGCALQQEKEKPQQPSGGTEQQPPVTVEKPVKANEVKTAINPDVLFMLLSAEIAGQRGHYDLAYQGYMEAARQVKDPKPAERAAMIAMYMKDNKKINQALSLWLKNDPKNINARKLALLTSLREKDKPNSISHMNELLTADPAGFEKTLFELADGLQQEGNISFLYDVLEDMSVQNPKQPSVFYAQSVMALQMKKLDEAETKIQQALLIQPDWDKALVLQGQIAVAGGDLDKAERLLRQASTKYPDNEKISKIYAQLLIRKADYEAAGDVYQQLIARNPNDFDSQFALALVHFQLDRDDKAEEIFTQLAEQPKWSNQASFYLGKLEEKRGNVDKAVAWFDKVGQGAYEFEAPLAAVAVLLKDKQFDAADVRLKTMEMRFPKQAVRITIMRAEVLSQQKKNQEAFQLLSNFLQQQPDNKDVLYTRALMAERIGRFDVLETDLKKILEKNPESAEALNALGYSLLDYPNRYAEAEKYLIKALRLQPDEPVIMDSYGWLQFKLGNPAKALIYLEQAYEKQQENEIAAHLAEVLWSLGRKDEARKLFNKAVKESPDDEYLLDFQKRILDKE